MAALLLDGTGATAVDIGANVGLTDRSARPPGGIRHVGGRVLAVEPVSANVARLRDNLALNGLDHADRAGQHPITLREDFVGGASTGNAALKIADGTDARRPTVTVQLRTLDVVVERHGNPHVSVVKADIEGHEDLMLAGGRRTFSRCRPIGFFEWNRHYYRRRQVQFTLAMQPLLDELGYRCLRLERGSWIEQRDFWSPRPIDDLILVPAERAPQLRTFIDTAHTTMTGRNRLRRPRPSSSPSPTTEDNHMTDNRKPTPTDQKQHGQPVPETQPEPQRPDHTPQDRTDEDAERKGTTRPGDA